jgi:hypothetical protein
MEFILLYPRGKNLFIEIVCDTYIPWQPRTEEELTVKVNELVPVVTELKEYCMSRGLNQIVIVNFEKAIHFEKLNFLLAAKMVRKLSEMFPDTLLKKIEFHNVSPVLKTIYDTMKGIIPRRIKDVISIIYTQ